MVKNQILRKFVLCFFLFSLLLCSMVSPVFAFTALEDDTSYTELVNIGRFTVCGILDDYQVPYAFSVIDDDGSTGVIDYEWLYDDFDESLHWYITSPSSVGAVYRTTQKIDGPGGNRQKYTFRSSQPFVITKSEWQSLMDYFSVTVPEGCDFTFTVSFSGYYPVEHPDGGYRWTRITGSDVALYDQDMSGAGTYTPVPFLSNVVGDTDFDSVFSKGVYCTELSFTVELYSYVSAIGQVQFTMPYQDSVNCVKPLDYFRQFPKENTVIVQVEELNASTIGAFLATAAGGFFEVEIIPGLSLGGILAAVVGVILLVAFLKMR